MKLLLATIAFTFFSAFASQSSDATKTAEHLGEESGYNMTLLRGAEQLVHVYKEYNAVKAITDPKARVAQLLEATWAFKKQNWHDSDVLGTGNVIDERNRFVPDKGELDTLIRDGWNLPQLIKVRRKHLLGEVESFKSLTKPQFKIYDDTAKALELANKIAANPEGDFDETKDAKAIPAPAPAAIKLAAVLKLKSGEVVNAVSAMDAGTEYVVKDTDKKMRTIKKEDVESFEKKD